jgi:hypothetical protein
MKLSLEQDRLTIELEWYEQFWAVTLERQLHIPLAQIDRVTTIEPQTTWMEVRAPGTFVPGVIKAGTYYNKVGKEFWYVTSDQNYLVLELQNGSYQRVVITIADHLAWAERIDRALTQWRSNRDL